jgi:hypothetical protein
LPEAQKKKLTSFSIDAESMKGPDDPNYPPVPTPSTPPSTKAFTPILPNHGVGKRLARNMIGALLLRAGSFWVVTMLPL